MYCSNVHRRASADSRSTPTAIWQTVGNLWRLPRDVRGHPPGMRCPATHAEGGLSRGPYRHKLSRHESPSRELSTPLRRPFRPGQNGQYEIAGPPTTYHRPRKIRLDKTQSSPSRRHCFEMLISIAKYQNQLTQQFTCHFGAFEGSSRFSQHDTRRLVAFVLTNHRSPSAACKTPAANQFAAGAAGKQFLRTLNLGLAVARPQATRAMRRLVVRSRSR